MHGRRRPDEQTGAAGRPCRLCPRFRGRCAPALETCGPRRSCRACARTPYRSKRRIVRGRWRFPHPPWRDRTAGPWPASETTLRHPPPEKRHRAQNGPSATADRSIPAPIGRIRTHATLLTHHRGPMRSGGDHPANPRFRNRSAPPAGSPPPPRFPIRVRQRGYWHGTESPRSSPATRAVPHPARRSPAESGKVRWQPPRDQAPGPVQRGIQRSPRCCHRASAPPARSSPAHAHPCHPSRHPYSCRFLDPPRSRHHPDLMVIESTHRPAHAPIARRCRAPAP